MQRKTKVGIGLMCMAVFLIAGCEVEEDNGTTTYSFQEIKKITASDGQSNDDFGISVAIDGNFAIVGAQDEAGAGDERGAAYIFSRNEGGTDMWEEVKKITASDTEDNDRFGFSVAIDGDYAVVGALAEAGAGYDRGAVYIFYRNEGGADNWGEVKKITSSDTQDGDVFGHSVAIQGDEILVGAAYRSETVFDQGAAYLFSRNQGGADNWGEVKKFVIGDPQNGDLFGYSVAINGDTAAVSAAFKAETGYNQGAVYVFERNLGGAGSWGEAKKLNVSAPEDLDRFGSAVAVQGDLIVVGAPNVDGDGLDRGAVYLFGRNQGGAENWGELKALTASDAMDGDGFGMALALNGEYVVIGAPLRDGGGLDRGTVYIFHRDEGGTDNWGEVETVTASDGEDQDRFGCAAAITGDYVIVGAEDEDGAGEDEGAAYLFKRQLVATPLRGYRP